MNKHAWAEIGQPATVDLWFDKINQIIGIVPGDPETGEGFPLLDVNNCTGKMIRASPFCTHYLIKKLCAPASLIKSRSIKME